MKKYIIPAVEVTALRSEGFIAGSFKVDPDVTVGGSGDTSSPGQLTNEFEWDNNDWND